MEACGEWEKEGGGEWEWETPPAQRASAALITARRAVRDSYGSDRGGVRGIVPCLLLPRTTFARTKERLKALYRPSEEARLHQLCPRGESECEHIDAESCATEYSDSRSMPSVSTEDAGPARFGRADHGAPRGSR